jgi:hypothetical protein
VFIYSSCGKWVFPPPPVEFSSHCHFYKISCSWLLDVCRHSCLLQPAYLFTVHMGSGPSPRPVELSSHHHFYKLSCSWLLGMCHCSCLLWLAYLQFCEGLPFPTFGAQGAPPSLPRVFFLFLLFIIQFFFFFPWVGGQSVQGAMLIWPRVVCGSTSPPGFSI